MYAARRRCRRAVTSLKRQHPNTNVMLLASALDPALMLEAMRAGVNEFVADPLSQAEFDAAITRLLGTADPGAGRAGLRVRRRQGWRRHDDDGGQRGDALAKSRRSARC